jgi:hypothetical protein
MSLVTYADTQALRGGEAVWSKMSRRVHDTNAPMPPRGYPALTAQELAALDAWFAARAPGSSQVCNNTNPTEPKVGPEHLPCTPSQFFRANGTAAGGKFPVPTGTKDRYVSFNFPNPFQNGEQAIAIAPVIDNARVIHHYILYSSTGSFVTGWAPGGVNSIYADDLGLVIDPAHYPGFRLQVHYNNIDGPDATDASGVAMCTTRTPGRQQVGVVTMGAFAINIPPRTPTTINGTCSNLAKPGKTLHVVSGSAHMHMTGTGFRTELFGSNGQSKAVITNIPDGTWSFDNQRPQPNLARQPVVNGDVFRVTCKYFWNPAPGDTRPRITFGEGTDDEMCFDFMSVYPIDDANRACLF